MAIDPKDIQVGDLVSLTGEVVYVDGDFSAISIKGTSLTIEIPPYEFTAATITRTVDPDILLLRRKMGEFSTNGAEYIARGGWDNLNSFKGSLAAIKEIRKEYEK